MTGHPGLGTPPRLYNQIAVQLAEHNGSDAVEMARLLALINVAMADAGLTCWETKYREEFWRPITGIRKAAGDGNSDTVGDVNWTPLGAPASNKIGPNFTPPFPAYTSGHATFGAAMFETLRKFYGTDRIRFTFVSDEFNGVTRDNQGNVRPLMPRSFQFFIRSRRGKRPESNLSRHPLGIRQERRNFPRPECCGLRVFPHLYTPAHVRPSLAEEQQALSLLERTGTIRADLCSGENSSLGPPTESRESR